MSLLPDPHMHMWERTFPSQTTLFYDWALLRNYGLLRLTLLLPLARAHCAGMQAIRNLVMLLRELLPRPIVGRMPSQSFLAFSSRDMLLACD